MWEMTSMANDSGWAVAQVDTELSVIFGDAGRQVVVKEFRERYGVSVRDAIARPSAFKEALFYLLGELGSSLVMGRINKRVWGLAATSIPDSGA